VIGSSPPDPDDDWGASPTHPEGAAPASAVPEPAVPGDDDWTADDPFASATAPETENGWEAAPPLPMALPAARPNAERTPKAKRRGATPGRRRGRGGRDDGGARRGDGDGGHEHGADGDADDAPPRRRVDRPPSTAEERLQLALKHAYRYLAKRDRTVAEVRAHLLKRETDPASLEAAVGELLELKYLDDERYVQRYVEDRRRLDNWGPVRITQGLRKMGIDPPMIAPAIAAVGAESEDDDVTLATDLVQRRFNHRPLDGDRDRQKALRAVVSKGHTLDVAYAAVRAYEDRCARDDG
jgi:SOS response regulatory protein OraA/RecX